MAECGNKEWVMKKGTHYKIEGFVALYIFFLLMICLFVYTIFFLCSFLFYAQVLRSCFTFWPFTNIQSDCDRI